MGQWDDDGPGVIECGADALVERASSQQAADRKATDCDDQLGPQQVQLPLEPEPAQFLLPRGGHPVARARRRAAGIAARDGSAVEGGVEGLLVEVEPAPQVLSRAPAPGAPLLPLDHAGRLAVHVGALPLVAFQDRKRLQWIARFGAGAADAVVALEGGEGAVRRPAPRQGPATITK